MWDRVKGKKVKHIFILPRYNFVCLSTCFSFTHTVSLRKNKLRYIHLAIPGTHIGTRINI